MSQERSPRGRNGNDQRSPSPRDRRQVSADRGRSRDRSRDDRRNKDPETYTQIYIAKLHRHTREDDIKDSFSKYGKISQVVLKHSYAFVDFEDHEAAVSAVREMDGKVFVNGETLVVEQSVPGGKRRRTGPQTEDVCFNCQKKGHWANECRNRRRSRSRDRRRSRSRSYDRDRRFRRHSRSRSNNRRRGGYRERERSPSYRGGGGRNDSRSRDMKEGRCFQCGKRGHLKRDCNEMRGGSSRSGSRTRGGTRARDNRRGGGRGRSPSSSRGRDNRRDKSRGRSGSSRRSYSRNPEDRNQRDSRNFQAGESSKHGAARANGEKNSSTGDNNSWN